MKCSGNQLLLAHGYDKPRQIWDGRGPHYLRLLDGASQISQLVYDDVNQVSAGLVERVEHMPDVQVTFRMWATEGLGLPPLGGHP